MLYPNMMVIGGLAVKAMGLWIFAMRFEMAKSWKKIFRRRIKCVNVNPQATAIGEAGALT